MNATKRKLNSKGFTLLEMVISIGIFSVLVIASVGINLGISNAQIKAANIQTILDNIRFSLELMTKEIRTGVDYKVTADRANICAPDHQGIRFFTSTGEDRIYFLSSDGKLMRYTVPTQTPLNCDDALPVTSEDVLVQWIQFDATGELAGGNDGQPRAIVSLGVVSRSPKFGADTSMILQTTIVQRLRDIP